VEFASAFDGFTLRNIALFFDQKEEAPSVEFLDNTRIDGRIKDEKGQLFVNRVSAIAASGDGIHVAAIVEGLHWRVCFAELEEKTSTFKCIHQPLSGCHQPVIVSYNNDYLIATQVGNGDCIDWCIDQWSASGEFEYRLCILHAVGVVMCMVVLDGRLYVLTRAYHGPIPSYAIHTIE
jgi:hypothetical protein